jgi:hypothetical protein
LLLTAEVDTNVIIGDRLREMRERKKHVLSPRALKIDDIYWAFGLGGERFTRRERDIVARTNFVTQWPVHQVYAIEGFGASSRTRLHAARESGSAPTDMANFSHSMLNACWNLTVD